MKLHDISHLDHSLTPDQIRHLEQRFADRSAFFIETIELPAELGTVPCGLHGPAMGDLPVLDTEVTYEKRGTRAWRSRLVDRPARQTRMVAVVAGPHEEHACVLYTAYGGPASPQEPGDIRKQLEELHEQRAGLHDMSDEYKVLD